MLTIVLWVCFGCTQKKPATVMVITSTGGLEYWETFDHPARTNAEAAGIHIELSAPQSAADHTEQAQIVENAVNRHAQGIIVSPTHRLVLTSVLERAAPAHIPVVIIGTPIAASDQDFAAFIGWNEAEAGCLAARRFVFITWCPRRSGRSWRQSHGRGRFVDREGPRG